VRQCRAAIAWTYHNAARFNSDPDRIYVARHSAGGHLTAMALLTAWEPEYGLPPDIIKGGCAFSGLYDLAPLPYTFVQPSLQLCSLVALLDGFAAVNDRRTGTANSGDPNSQQQPSPGRGEERCEPQAVMYCWTVLWLRWTPFSTSVFTHVMACALPDPLRGFFLKCLSDFVASITPPGGSGRSE
jgi:acetyl esterase/lipase